MADAPLRIKLRVTRPSIDEGAAATEEQVRGRKKPWTPPAWATQPQETLAVEAKDKQEKRKRSAPRGKRTRTSADEGSTGKKFKANDEPSGVESSPMSEKNTPSASADGSDASGSHSQIKTPKTPIPNPTVDTKSKSTPSVATPGSATPSAVPSARESPLGMDIKSRPRTWQKQRVRIRVLGGGDLEIPVWFSAHPMLLNDEYAADDMLDYRRTHTPPVRASPSSGTPIHPSHASTPVPRPYVCTQASCSKSFHTLDALRLHERNMHGDKNLVCGINGCDKRFATNGQMIKHQKMVHWRGVKGRVRKGERIGIGGPVGGPGSTASEEPVPKSEVEATSAGDDTALPDDEEEEEEEDDVDVEGSFLPE